MASPEPSLLPLLQSADRRSRNISATSVYGPDKFAGSLDSSQASRMRASCSGVNSGSAFNWKGMLRALGFAFTSASHSHRHTADKWARPAVTPYRPQPQSCGLRIFSLTGPRLICYLLGACWIKRIRSHETRHPLSRHPRHHTLPESGGSRDQCARPPVAGRASCRADL